MTEDSEWNGRAASARRRRRPALRLCFVSGKAEPQAALVLGLDEHLLSPVGSETVRDIDQPTAVFLRVCREAYPSSVGNLVAEVTEQHSPEASLFLVRQRCDGVLHRPHPDVVKISDQQDWSRHHRLRVTDDLEF
ncbi:hypothetical protein [Streptomyces sp. NPDC055134]